MAGERFVPALPAVSHPSHTALPSVSSPSVHLVFSCLSEGSSFLPPTVVGIGASHCRGVRGSRDMWGETLARMLPFPQGDGDILAHRLPLEHPLMLPSSAYCACGTGQVTSVPLQASGATHPLTPEERGPLRPGAPELTVVFAALPAAELGAAR